MDWTVSERLKLMRGLLTHSVVLDLVDIAYCTLHPRTNMLDEKLCIMTVDSMLLSIERRLSMTSCLSTESSSSMDAIRSRHSSNASKCMVTGVEAEVGMLLDVFPLQRPEADDGRACA